MKAAYPPSCSPRGCVPPCRTPASPRQPPRWPSGEDAAGAVEALVGALAAERCAFVVDDAHHAQRDAGLLIARLAEQLQPQQHLVVLARRLPPGAGRLRRADHVQLTAADLALRADETLQLCRTGFGLDVGPAEVAALERATGGWTAAAALAGARAKRTGEDVGALAAVAGDPGRPASAVGAILAEALDTLAPGERLLLAQVGRLPLLGPRLVDAATGIEGYFARALAAGIPFTPGQSQWWDLPGPVRDYLVAFAAPDPAVLRRAAAEYSRRGQLGRPSSCCWRPGKRAPRPNCWPTAISPRSRPWTCWSSRPPWTGCPPRRSRRTRPCC